MNGSKKMEEPDILRRPSQFLRLKVLLNLRNKRKRRRNNLKRRNNQRKNNPRRRNPRNKNKIRKSRRYSKPETKEEKKAANPLDLLPPSPFNLDDYKR